MAVGEDRPYIACLAVVNPEQFDKFVKELGKDPKAEGILMDKEVRNAALRRIKALTRDFPNYGIPRNVRLSEAPSHGKSIIHYDIKSKGADAYLNLAKEVALRDPARMPQPR